MKQLELPLSELQETPILEALKQYINQEVVRFHMPGHKGASKNLNLLTELCGEKIFQADVTNVPGMDDLHQAQGIIQNAQDLAADTFGADKTYFLINGSSCGLQAVVASLCGPGEQILVSRNMHRSILSGIIISGAIPVFCVPEYNSEHGIALGNKPEDIRQTLDENPESKAVLLVNPTYHGITSNISAIAKVVHQRNIPLAIDEAHGPHLYFNNSLPKSALEQGADVCVQGTHKILAALTQASMLHLKGSRVSRQKLEAALKLLQSTSTSYLLLASLDTARAQMASYGRELTQQALELSSYLKRKIQAIPGLTVLEKNNFRSSSIYDMDPTKIIISVKGLNISGFQAEQWLRENCYIQVEMSDLFNILLIVTFGNNKKDANIIVDALRKMSKAFFKGAKPSRNLIAITKIKLPELPELVISPREAFWSPVVNLPISKTVGSISAEVIACYPPGIPIICPGEKITSEIVEYLISLKNIGAHMQGCHDPSLESISVVK